MFIQVMKIEGAKEITTPRGLTSVIKISVKDIRGKKSKISLWKGHPSYGKLILNSVYVFSKLATDKFPKQKPYHLTTRYDTKIEEASESLSKQFEFVTNIDGSCQGEVIGVNCVYCYKSCLECGSSIKTAELGAPCPRCDKVINDFENNFSCEVIIDDGEEFQTFVGFKNSLKCTNISGTVDEVETSLNKEFQGVKVTLEFMEKYDKHGNLERIIQEFSVISYSQGDKKK